MRLLLITGIFPPDIGGPATYVPQLAKALSQRGHQVTVLTLSDRLDHDDGHFPFTVVRLPRHLHKPWRWLRTITQIVRLGRQVDVLFANGLVLETVWANYWLRKPLVQKVVGDLAWEQASGRGWVTDNFETFQQQRYGLKVETLKWLCGWWTRQADRLIVPSRYLANWVEQWGIPGDKISVIYNAVGLPCPAVGEPHGGGGRETLPSPLLPLSTPVKLVTVGRLVSWKHVDQVIEAVARCEGAGLVIVGDGPERAGLERLTRVSGLTERVYFAGQCSHAATLAVMAACDLFVLNSTYEGLPHVVLEAMSLGLPVLATAVGGTPELVQDGKNGRLISSQDDGALYMVLLELLSTPLERQRLAIGARQSLRSFSVDAMVEATAALLYDVTRRASGRRA
jgi:glycosyltransferase involved in cell wall biosynthesis